MLGWAESKRSKIEHGLRHWSCDESGQLYNSKGKPASVSSVSDSGYLVTNICNFVIPQHHIVWFLTYGKWAYEIDHIDRCRTNNRINNLRDVTRSINNVNRKSQGSCDIHGVYKIRKTGNYQVRIQCAGLYRSKVVHSYEEAVRLRGEWEKEIYEANRY